MLLANQEHVNRIQVQLAQPGFTLRLYEACGWHSIRYGKYTQIVIAEALLYNFIRLERIHFKV